ncbi:serine/arginine repetitive matrix protein 2-like [Juglans microcarpa x Juglans regia]|uniref:serine/arginine repetitive matrix protein 2-like n=1 Tax=Juglans microcarpa x Juglans regia TaxID=2249226 RepID=UPI001B7F4B79|nr:serine/arginine repetitive matrix protein 2-like [Juglans microcarpa x Juglans regia]XP_041017138.1 serine/arginine repetitive matrix protein 2-like [Juglans microcarpa x Juglans regia]XP_041017139.1 serine/arginine repetitive matrix protein 2-like [Juglans microcarpa x Juglans regia]
MYNGIGLQTPRGSGTNGYIQSNRFLIKSKTGRVSETTKGFEANQGTAGITRKPNKDILEHDCKRQIELKLVVLQDTLIDQGYTDAEIAEKLEDARRTLEAAAATSQDGPTAIAGANNKLSETQTHQIAARKEKQLETLRAAFGISASELEEHSIEGNDDARDGQKNVPSDNIKREHAFLDREFRSKKNMEEDQKVEKDDKKKGVKESGRHKKEETKKRRHESDSSDTDSSGKHAKGLQAKHHRSNRRSDHDISVDKKHRPLKKHKKSRVHDSDDSDSATDSGENVDVRKTSKNHNKSRVHDSDDSDSATDSDRDVGKKHKTSKNHKNRKHDSDDSESDSDSVIDEDGIGHESSKKQAKYKKSSRRHGSDDDSDFDEGSSKQQSQKGNQQTQTRGRHDSEDETNDTNSEVEERRIQLEKENDQHSRGRWKEGVDSDVEDIKKSSNGRHGKRSRMNDVVDEYDSERARKHKREITDKSLRSRRHDSDDDDFGTGTDEQIKKGGIRRHNTDEDYGVSYDQRNANRTAGKHKTVEEAAVSPRNDIDNDLYRSGRDTMDRSRYRSQEVMKGKRNPDDGKEDPESKLSSRNYVKEAEHIGEQLKDSKLKYELNTKAHLSKDDHKRDTRLRSVGQQDSKTVEQGGRSYSKDDEPQRISRKDDRVHEELGGRGRQSRYEEEHRVRKHRRDEDYEYTRHERANAEQRGGSRRQARGEEVERENRSHEMDRRMDYSKRARYDDLRSSERKMYDDRRDDDRARR